MFNNLLKTPFTRVLSVYAFALLLAVMFASCVPQSAHAQSLKVATGSQKGTYSTMLKELKDQCSIPAITEQVTDGSMTNVDMLIGNQVNAAFVQTDVLFFRARTENLGNVKTLLALHPEEVHIVALAQPRKEGGVMGIGAKEVALNTVSDLAGRQVGAAGGSYITAQVIRLQSEIPFQVVGMVSNDELLKSVASGKLDAAIIVGGSPLGVISALDNRFKLLGVPELVQGKLKSVYSPAKLTYSRMGAAGVPSISTDAVFVTREYKMPKMVSALAEFRRCAIRSIPEIKESLGTHPKWQAVETENRGKWAWYDLK